ncbi:MAG: hypothetical protein QOG68_829 [Solirubrobacteraceae bacterium]|nr:hypothetical protein [Solirubrobacteraceae bacterium]
MRALPFALTLTLLVPAAGASASGGYPFGAQAGPAGVTTPGSAARYVTIDSGTNTVLERIQRAGGQVSAWRTLHGRLVIPAIAMDGTPGGLSADEGTLVLVRPLTTFPISRTPLAIVDTHTMHVRKLSLKGMFAFDAVSPDGRSLYLTEYPSSDLSAYVVRRYDVARGRLAPGAVVDRRNPGEEMRGSPLTRVASADGRWAYTLYDGAQNAPFIHALDTARGRAFCIDLDALMGNPQLYGLRLQLAGGRLQVLDRGEPLASVDTATFHVTTGAPAPVRTRPTTGAADAGSGGLVWPLALGAALAAGFGVAMLRLTRRRRAVASR